MNKTATYEKGERSESTSGHQKKNKKTRKLKINWNSLSKSSATQDMFFFMLAQY